MGQKMSTESAKLQILREVGSWPGVSVFQSSQGIVFLMLGRRELGHIHGNRLVDIPFPVRIRKQLVASGRAELHHIHPRSGWISYYIGESGDIGDVVRLFRLNYSRPWLNPGAWEPYLSSPHR